MESLIITTSSKADIYKEILPQIGSLTSGESDMIANMANISAILKEAFDFLWVGFYIVKGDELVLGPFQGPIACTRIKYGRGVCGAAWERNETVVVPDVDKYPGHIACSSVSRSEIVVPVRKEGECIAVLDIDSTELNSFDNIDVKYLEQMLIENF